jgi:hypothetical protein
LRRCADVAGARVRCMRIPFGASIGRACGSGGPDSSGRCAAAASRRSTDSLQGVQLAMFHC